jgi:hypothetical protein
MKTKKRNLVTCLVVGIIGLWGILFNSAETLYADSTDSAYSVSANIPEEQTNKDVSYFDLTVAPNDTRELSIHLSNVGEKDSVFEIEINNAATNTNGVIDYNQSSFKKDAFAKYTISDVLTTDATEVTVKAGEAKNVYFHLKMPKEALDGILLGGIHVSKQDNQSEKVSGTAIRNKYAYVVGVELRNNSNPVTPDLKLLSVKAGLQSSSATIFAHLQNPTLTQAFNLLVEDPTEKAGSWKLTVRQMDDFKDNDKLLPATLYYQNKETRQVFSKDQPITIPVTETVDESSGHQYTILQNTENFFCT